uniref:Uncharacterized protein n=1 Tax=viral metagenome TaxID=1070528 RepID=A0A6C0HSN9_9ZZZZ
MKVVFRFVNAPGFGDNIRGLITILQIQKKINFDLEVDFSHHVFSNFFVHTSNLFISNYKQYMFWDENIRNDFLMNEITTDMTISTNSYPIIEEIDEDIKMYLKKLFELKPEVKEYLKSKISNLPKEYNLFHYRLGDEVLIYNQVVNNNIYLQNFKKNIKENAVVISDSLTFKEIIFNDYENVTVFLNKPTHTGNTGNNEENIDTLVDFFLLTNAKSVNCYSIYRWISNFVFWTSIVYNVPLFNIKN